MKPIFVFLFLLLTACSEPQDTASTRQEKHAAQTNIIRDSFGVPHIYGKTDTDAVLVCYTPSAKMIFNG